MKLLLDTHLLLWTVGVSGKLPAIARSLIEDPLNDLVFSSVSIWEVAIKNGTKRRGFDVDARLIRRTLLASDYTELPATGEHALAVVDLPPIHKDPFDRLLIAQSIVEGLTLLTSDATVARYPAPVRQV